MSTWTEADMKAHYDRLKRPVEEKPAPRGRKPWTPKMNNTERAYAQYLLTQTAAGDVLWYAFQPVTLLLAPDCRFTPDFMVLYSDGRLELHDTKGARKRNGKSTYYAHEDATIKARVTSAKFPIPVYFVWSIGSLGWGKKGFGE